MYIYVQLSKILRSMSEEFDFSKHHFIKKYGNEKKKHFFLNALLNNI